MVKPIVVVETPYRAKDEAEAKRNEAYLRAALRDSLLRGEAPFASHALYTLPGVLEDDVATERNLGMNAGWEFYTVADKAVVYMDLGLSEGMRQGIDRAKYEGATVEYRTVKGWAQ